MHINTQARVAQLVEHWSNKPTVAGSIPVVSNYIFLLRCKFTQRFGAAVARWAHNPKVRGSKPRIAIYTIFFYVCHCVCACTKYT